MEKTKLLCLADLHHFKREELDKIKDLEFDMCFLLGDIPQNAFEIIAKNAEGKPIYGVQGNHDDWGIFEGSDVRCLHKTTTAYNGYLFLGFGSSNRYKSGDYAMVTQEESVKILKNWGIITDNKKVLISHDSMYKLFNKTDHAHIGLKGITKFIKRNRVKLNICGHHHENKVIKKHGCTVICVYRCALISLPEMITEKIF